MVVSMVVSMVLLSAGTTDGKRPRLYADSYVHIARACEQKLHGWMPLHLIFLLEWCQYVSG